MEKLEAIQLSKGEYVNTSGLEKTVVFSTRSLYKHLTFEGVISTRMHDLRKSKLSIKSLD